MGEAVPCSTRLCKGNITRIIDELECQEKIRSLLLSETAFIPSIERRLSRYIWEKIMWCQYTRYKQLKEGNDNIVFFHKAANMRKQVNKIHCTMMDKGPIQDMKLSIIIFSCTLKASSNIVTESDSEFLLIQIHGHMSGLSGFGGRVRR